MYVNTRGTRSFGSEQQSTKVELKDKYLCASKYTKKNLEGFYYNVEFCLGTSCFWVPFLFLVNFCQFAKKLFQFYFGDNIFVPFKKFAKKLLLLIFPPQLPAKGKGA
jgi:hypothetical protein